MYRGNNSFKLRGIIAFLYCIEGLEVFFSRGFLGVRIAGVTLKDSHGNL